MSDQDLKPRHQLMHDKLAQLGIAHEEITVFGTLRTNVHVICVAHDTARRWLTVLQQVFPQGRVSCVKHSWYTKVNGGTCLLPTTRNGYLIGVID